MVQLVTVFPQFSSQSRTKSKGFIQQKRIQQRPWSRIIILLIGRYPKTNKQVEVASEVAVAIEPFELQMRQLFD